MRPFNEGEKQEIAEFLPKLDAMPDGLERVRQHIQELTDELRAYRSGNANPLISTEWAYKRANWAVRTIRAYRWIAEQKGWTL